MIDPTTPLYPVLSAVIPLTVWLVAGLLVYALVYGLCSMSSIGVATREERSGGSLFSAAVVAFGSERLYVDLVTDSEAWPSFFVGVLVLLFATSYFFWTTRHLVPGQRCLVYPPGRTE